MVTADIIGFIGLAGIAFAWIYESIQVVKHKKVDVPFTFTIIYICASTLLTIYSIIIGDIIFIMLNALATLSALINFFVAIKYK